MRGSGPTVTEGSDREAKIIGNRQLEIGNA